MVANNTGSKVRALAAQYPGMLGHLFGPGAQRGPVDGFPYAFDNNRFGVWKKGQQWNRDEWLKLMRWGTGKEQPALWAVVPDVVADRDATLRDWREYSPIVREYGYPLAFAVQDGMTALDIPSNADVVFVGGSTEWKWATVSSWCADFPRVHVARVNTYRLLCKAHDAGAESSDGTGWLMGDQRQWRDLCVYCAECSGGRNRIVQENLFAGGDA